MPNNQVKLRKDGPIPLYHQMKEVIKKQIESRDLKAGDRLPSENELIDHYGVSRTTVRQAVNELVLEGYLVRKRGLGTFVAKPKHSQWELEQLSSFAEELERKGLSSTTQVLSLEKVETNIDLRSIFGNDFKEFYCLERLRFVENQPAVVVTTYLPVDLAPGLEHIDMSANSLYDVLQKIYKLDISHAYRTYLPINAQEKDAKLLDIELNKALQLVRTTAYLGNGTAFEYSVSRDRGDMSSYKVLLKYKK